MSSSNNTSSSNHDGLSRVGRIMRSKELFEDLLVLFKDGVKLKVFRKHVDYMWADRFASHQAAIHKLLEELAKPVVRPPIPMLLRCPCCNTRHIDKGEFAGLRFHKVHACQNCGENFKPSNEFTVGVHFLPGHQDESGSK